MIARPYFSIVMPVFNRPLAVRRAIDSCLAQDFDAFEVVVVDDGSTDGTVDAISHYSDPRVRLVRHQNNRGVCPARNTAIRSSHGEWLIFVDSDHELLPGCLSRVYRQVSAADGADRFGFQYAFDDGRVSPSSLPPEPVVGYAEWLRWIEKAQWTDALWVTHRRCFEVCRLPESYALEFSYFLDFAKQFQSRMFPLVLAFQHTDSADRLSYMTPPADPEMVRRKAADQAIDWQYILAEHGAALRRLAPRRYEAVLRNAAISSLLAGMRGTAFRTVLQALRFYPASLYVWITALLVLAGDRNTLRFNRMRSEMRYRRHNPGQSAPVGQYLPETSAR